MLLQFLFALTFTIEFSVAVTRKFPQDYAIWFDGNEIVANFRPSTDVRHFRGLPNPGDGLPSSPATGGAEDDASRNIVQLIESRGFEAVEFSPRTPDGYILNLVRIVNPFNKFQKPKPVILQHGLFTSGSSWLWQPGGDAEPSKNPRTVRHGDRTNGNLGFVLANYGYDVWISNFRGNSYSQNHSNMEAGLFGKFWEFSINELARLDISTVVRYVMKKTLKKRIAFVGHSLGASSMLASLSLYKDFNDIIKPAILLSPFTRTSNSSSVMSALKIFAPFSTTALRYMPFAFGPQLKLGGDQLTLDCGVALVQSLCLIMMGIAVGYDSKQLNRSHQSVYMAHASEPTSSWVYDHFVQNSISNKFNMFDYGPVDNARHYGLSKQEPPEFKLSSISNEFIALFYSKSDSITAIEDVQWTKQQMAADPFIDYVIPVDSWNHMDFVWAMDTGKYINPQVLRVLVKAGVYSKV
ncbi:Lipase member N [Halotydeus destructor]|nr:Lipase member N [Halotydeus destructor]